MCPWPDPRSAATGAPRIGIDETNGPRALVVPVPRGSADRQPSHIGGSKARSSSEKALARSVGVRTSDPRGRGKCATDDRIREMAAMIAAGPSRNSKRRRIFKEAASLMPALLHGAGGRSIAEVRAYRPAKLTNTKKNASRRKVDAHSLEYRTEADRFEEEKPMPGH